MRQKNIVPLGSFARDSLVKRGLLASGLFWVVGSLFLVITFFKLPPVVPLFYSLIRGEPQLASKQFLLLLPLMSLASFVIHLWLARFNFDIDRTLSRLLSITSAFVSFLFMIATLHIIIIVL